MSNYQTHRARVDATKARVEAVTGLSLNNREIGNAIQDAIDLCVADQWPDSRMVEVLSSNVPDNMPGELAREKYLRAQIAKSAGASAPPAREINWKELYEQKVDAFNSVVAQLQAARDEIAALKAAAVPDETPIDPGMGPGGDRG